MTHEIITAHCSQCHDTFIVTDEILGVSTEYSNTPFYNAEQLDKDIDSSLNWWMSDKTCLNCGETYRPHKTGVRMDNFVYYALKRVGAQ